MCAALLEGSGTCCSSEGVRCVLLYWRGQVRAALVEGSGVCGSSGGVRCVLL